MLQTCVDVFRIRISDQSVVAGGRVGEMKVRGTKFSVDSARFGVHLEQV